MQARTVMGALVGVGAALGGHLLTRRAAPHLQREGAAIGLVTAAAIYPLARRGGAGSAGEVATLAAATGVAAFASALPDRRGRAVLAAAWLAHAGFDAAFKPSDASRIPSWYPAACAGYDATLAALLLRPSLSGVR